ncbi:MAG: hypothetical protein EBT38_01485 [Acidimicrobiia bacterium]|nr:hypothetical protein [Acidimicrobiia bacterium]NDF68489.1 hypothetical protein [Actinomycetota bacterium]NDG10273.1 hypothetical protein [Actinomycetota bacterium]
MQCAHGLVGTPLITTDPTSTPSVRCRPILTRESVSADKSASRQRLQNSLCCYLVVATTVAAANTRQLRNGGATMTTRSTTTATPLGRVVLDDASNGRKGPSYDWQALLIPSEPVFEASLQTMLESAPVVSRTRKPRRRS